MNQFDDGFAEWFEGCYRATIDKMPVDQRIQVEAAFYAGAAFAGRCAEDHGHAVVIDAIKDHIQRCQARSSAPTQDNVEAK